MDSKDLKKMCVALSMASLLSCLMAGSPESESGACVPLERQDWAKASSQFLSKEAARLSSQEVPIMFIGDSITQLWRFEKDNKFPGGADSWRRHFEPLGAVNFGIAGDRLENLLWRITEGGQLQCKPKLIVLLIGTNNLHGSRIDSPEQIAEGIGKIVSEMRERTPSSKILLLGLLPRIWGKEDNDKVKKVNSIICKLDDGSHVFYMDAGPKLLGETGTVSKEVFRDGLHLSPEGYEIFAGELLPQIDRLLDKTPKR